MQYEIPFLKNATTTFWSENKNKIRIGFCSLLFIFLFYLITSIIFFFFFGGGGITIVLLVIVPFSVIPLYSTVLSFLFLFLLRCCYHCLLGNINNLLYIAMRSCTFIVMSKNSLCLLLGSIVLFVTCRRGIKNKRTTLIECLILFGWNIDSYSVCSEKKEGKTEKWEVRIVVQYCELLVYVMIIVYLCSIWIILLLILLYRLGS